VEGWKGGVSGRWSDGVLRLAQIGGRYAGSQGSFGVWIDATPWVQCTFNGPGVGNTCSWWHARGGKPQLHTRFGRASTSCLSWSENGTFLMWLPCSEKFKPAVLAKSKAL
jgi:hypothetical protein